MTDAFALEGFCYSFLTISPSKFSVQKYKDFFLCKDSLELSTKLVEK